MKTLYQCCRILADKLHSGMFRNDGVTPYIKHPIDVVDTLLSAGVTEDWILGAAVLHDVKEENPKAFQYKYLEDMFEEYFPEETESYAEKIGLIVATVDDLTFYPTYYGEFFKNDRLNRKVQKAQYLADFIEMSDEVVMIKVADRLCNVRDFMETDIKYAKRYFEYAYILFAEYNRRVKFGDALCAEIEKLYEELFPLRDKKTT